MERAGVRIHALDVGLLHPVGGGRPEREDGLRVYQVGLGLRQKLVASVPVERAVGLVEHGGELRVRPARLVVAARRGEEAEEGVRVYVVGHVARAREALVFEPRAGAVEGFGLHAAQRNRDAEVPLPLLLQELRRNPQRLGGVVGEFDFARGELRRVELA